MRIDLHCGMHLRGGRAADEQRYIKALALHFFRHMTHFFERGGDQPGNADNVSLVFAYCLKYFLGMHHNTEIDDIYAVAL